MAYSMAGPLYIGWYSVWDNSADDDVNERWHHVVALVGANRSPRLGSHDPINASMVVPRASKPALYFYNRGGIAIAIAVVTTVVAVRTIVAVIWIGIWIRKEEREAKRID